MNQSATGKRLALLAFVLSQFTHLAYAEEPCQERAGRFASIEGHVQVRGSEPQQWRTAKLSDPLCKGDTVRVGELSRAAVVLVNEAVMRLDQNTTMRLIDINGKKEKRSLIELLKGAIQTFIRKPRLLSVNTPYLNGSIEGTEFQVRVEADRASILVQEGRVLASNTQGSVAVKPGEAADAQAGTAPTSRMLVRPRDAVQWTLYYPPVMASTGGSEDTAAAFDALNQVAEGDRDAAYHLQRASLLLSVGRQDEAQVAIDTALQSDPNAGLGHALRAIIHIVRNERDQALVEADKAVSLGDTAAARIAQSYALQANFRIEAARDTLLAAVSKHPEDALAWARLSELWLMLGDKEQSRTAAAKAASLAPNLARTQLVQGFAALADYRDANARSSFQRAIELSPSDPLAHLGLGLSLISSGQLEAGRGELEVAVALDSNQALLRAYLGKAYFEEKRSPLDDQQFGIAKSLDPLDPTAYLYDGIRKQTENRPVEALEDLEQSIALNDNRAVYRSRLLLDKDQASRGTSLARVYNDLGFAKLGIEKAAESVTLDPANASAHRFLSDAYQSIARHETARVSELQQAQMLQDVNINPIQPSLSDTNLNVVSAGGPASAGFNEFTPLFERNMAQANFAVFGGNNSTLGGEAVVSGVYDKLSLSAGAFGYDTDGFRPNNDLKHEIYNLFAQVAVTPQVNLQAEFQKRDTEYGDLKMNFDPASYSANQRNSLQTDSTRLGARFNLSPRSTFLLLYNHKNVDTTQTDQVNLDEYFSAPPGTFPPGESAYTFEGVKAEADQYEGAFIHQADRFNLIAGAAYSQVDRTDKAIIMVPLFDPIFPIIDDAFDIKSKDKRAYAYGNIVIPTNLTWTLGLSYQKYEEIAYDLSKINPKLGVQWQANDALRLRAAYFKVLKPVLASNRTLEPTQIAGFNQYLDDVEATRSTRYGVGADLNVSRSVALGAELTRRKLKTPTPDIGGNIVFDDRNEWTHRAYAYWTPSTNWALKAEAVYDKFENDESSPVAGIFPARVRTVSVPLKATYFHPAGYFGGVGVTYVDQSVSRDPVSTLPQGDSSFSLVDLSVGYKLPKRMGVVSLSVHNLFDKHFKYQDDSYREFGDEPSAAPYTPERMIMGKFTLSF